MSFAKISSRIFFTIPRERFTITSCKRYAMPEEAAALYDCAPRFLPIGDCVVVGNISDATLAARTVAEDIGR